ncbi:DedA family protein [Campylobacter upsaliensis]|uniref:DedA family protein n=1 Tax=Campylobacter upsaliensis TaxID=28080 RepID=A0A5L4Q2B1_CAMUP|nr:DedA family protein [Campylobacter upsaliensis]EAI2899903.1 DedA family protein [Campylobacter upsaliensis]EAI4357051.1 DedA family protein [Campylobacter upsaliensis]EAI7128114.1 DedA family protein [Campylobacter upsaliensis]EAI8232196.1 DedA family protein [Campylobacter upsaliensis]EAI9943963.1 DedA family protein [Campylobacter upsaliensis]
MQEIFNFIIETASAWGYLGIIILMTLESCFIPFPSEVVMIPAGYLAHKGELDFSLCILSGVLGSVLGALINYYLCFFWGRDFILRYGRFFGITEEKFAKFEVFFNRHGEFSTFVCRLLPGIRQYISMPAGLAKMRLINFVIFTAAGSGIWVSILVFLGYFLGENEDLIKEYLHQILLFILLFVFIAGLIYIKIKKPFTKEKQ